MRTKTTRIALSLALFLAPALVPTLAANALAFALQDAIATEWLTSVPHRDHAAANPLAGKPDAAKAGGDLFADHCAHCHGKDAMGKGRKPPLKSDRVKNASDGDLAWILKNGVADAHMPDFAELSDTQRWQLVAYLRSLNSAAQ